MTKHMTSAGYEVKVGDKLFLDRHTRGWGQVEVRALCDTGLVIVWDAEQGIDYPAEPKHLRRWNPTLRGTG